MRDYYLKLIHTVLYIFHYYYYYYYCAKNINKMSFVCFFLENDFSFTLTAICSFVEVNLCLKCYINRQSSMESIENFLPFTEYI